MLVGGQNDFYNSVCKAEDRNDRLLQVLDQVICSPVAPPAGQALSLHLILNLESSSCYLSLQALQSLATMLAHYGIG